jgi:hypothetical protein
MLMSFTFVQSNLHSNTCPVEQCELTRYLTPINKTMDGFTIIPS